MFVFPAFPSLYGVAASSLVGLYDLVLVSVVSPFVRRCDEKPFCICYAVEFFLVGLRESLFVHVHWVLLVLEVALHDSSVIVFLCETQFISLNFVILQSFHYVNLFEYSSMLTCELQGHTR